MQIKGKVHVCGDKVKNEGGREDGCQDTINPTASRD